MKYSLFYLFLFLLFTSCDALEDELSSDSKLVHHEFADPALGLDLVETENGMIVLGLTDPESAIVPFNPSYFLSSYDNDGDLISTNEAFSNYELNDIYISDNKRILLAGSKNNVATIVEVDNDLNIINSVTIDKPGASVFFQVIMNSSGELFAVGRYKDPSPDEGLLVKFESDLTESTNVTIPVEETNYTCRDLTILNNSLYTICGPLSSEGKKAFVFEYNFNVFPINGKALGVSNPRGLEAVGSNLVALAENSSSNVAELYKLNSELDILSSTEIITSDVSGNIALGAMNANNSEVVFSANYFDFNNEACLVSSVIKKYEVSSFSKTGEQIVSCDDHDALGTYFLSAIPYSNSSFVATGLTRNLLLKEPLSLMFMNNDLSIR